MKDLLLNSTSVASSSPLKYMLSRVEAQALMVDIHVVLGTVMRG